MSKLNPELYIRRLMESKTPFEFVGNYMNLLQFVNFSVLGHIQNNLKLFGV